MKPDFNAPLSTDVLLALGDPMHVVFKWAGSHEYAGQALQVFEKADVPSEGGVASWTPLFELADLHYIHTVGALVTLIHTYRKGHLHGTDAGMLEWQRRLRHLAGLT